MGKIWNKKEMLVFCTVLILTVTFLIYISINDKESSAGFYTDYNIELLTSDWLHEKDGKVQYVSIPNELDVDADDKASLHRVLPATLQEGTAICFKTKHMRVAVLVDNEVVYTYGWDKEPLIGETPGSIWNIVELKKSYAGKKLTIFTESPYSLNAGKFSNVVMGQKNDVMLYVLRDSFLKFFISCIPLVLKHIAVPS